MTMEPLYGQKDLAEFCEFVIASLFEIAPQGATPGNAAAVSGPSSSTTTTLAQQYGREGIDTPPYTPPLDGNPARKEPPALLEFIAYALYRTRLPTCIVNQSLLLLSRLKQRYPSARGTSSSPHRLFLSSLMLSAKISMDDTYSNKSWAIVGSSFFPLREVNQMERELFAFLGWNVVATNEELEAFTASAQASYKAHKDAKRAERVKRRRLEEDEARESRHRQATNAARALLRPHTYRHSATAQQGGSGYASPTHSRSPSRTRNSAASASASTHPYTPISSTASMQASPVASTSSAVASPAIGGGMSSVSSSMPSSAYQSRATSPSSIAMAAATSSASTSSPVAQMSSASASSSSLVSGSRTAAHQHHHFHHGHYTPSAGCSLTSSAVSSAFPSASHSPTSPASEPLSAGPQTPDSDCHHLQQHHSHASSGTASAAIVSADFPEADSYVSKAQSQQQWHQHPYKAARGISPPNRRSYHSATSPDQLAHAISQQLQQVQA